MVKEISAAKKQPDGKVQFCGICSFATLISSKFLLVCVYALYFLELTFYFVSLLDHNQ